MPNQQDEANVKEQPVLTEADLPTRDPYEVKGYGVKTPGYDGPYLDGHDFDPNFVYAMSGNPKSQAKFQNELKELSDAVDSERSGDGSTSGDSDSNADSQGELETSENGVVQTTEGPVEVTDFNAGSEVRKDVLFGQGVEFEDTKLSSRVHADDPRNPTNYETKPGDNADELTDSEPSKSNSETLPGEGQPDNFFDKSQGPKEPQIEPFDPNAVEK